MNPLLLGGVENCQLRFGDEERRHSLVAQLPSSAKYSEVENMRGYGVGNMTAESRGWDLVGSEAVLTIWSSRFLERRDTENIYPKQ